MLVNWFFFVILKFNRFEWSNQNDLIVIFLIGNFNEFASVRLDFRIKLIDLSIRKYYSSRLYREIVTVNITYFDLMNIVYSQNIFFLWLFTRYIYNQVHLTTEFTLEFVCCFRLSQVFVLTSYTHSVGLPIRCGCQKWNLRFSCINLNFPDSISRVSLVTIWL